MFKIQTESSFPMRVCDSQISSTGVKIPCITGRVSQAEVISQNGYRYKSTFWNKIIGDPIVQDSIKNREMLGMIEHPEKDEEYMKTPYEKAALCVMRAWVQDNDPYCVFGLLNNEHGNAIKAILDVGVRPGVSTRGMGVPLKDEVSQFIDEDNYCLIVWDIVRNPNFKELKLSQVSDSAKKLNSYNELLQMYQLRDSVDTSYNSFNLESSIDKALKEFKDSLLFNLKNNFVK